MPASPDPVRLFIGSSSEWLPVAHNLQAVLEQRHICEVEVWDQGLFEPSRHPLESLLQIAERVDFAVLVASADDVTLSRGESSASVRDNVVLEYGLFTGALGRERTYLLATGDRGLKLPTDALGLTRLPYTTRTDGNLRAAVNDAALQIEQQVTRQGRHARRPLAAPGVDSARAALEKEIARLCDNARAQGWTVKDNETTLRLRPPRGPVHSLAKGRPAATRTELRRFARELRAAGLRVNHSVRRPVGESDL